MRLLNVDYNYTHPIETEWRRRVFRISKIWLILLNISFFSFLTHTHAHNQHSVRKGEWERAVAAWEWRLKMFWQKREMSSFDSQWSKNTIEKHTHSHKKREIEKKWKKMERRNETDRNIIQNVNPGKFELDVNISVFLIPPLHDMHCTYKTVETSSSSKSPPPPPPNTTSTHTHTPHLLLLSAWCCAHDGWK